MKVTPVGEAKLDHFAGETFFFLNVFLHQDLVDLAKSNVAPEVINKGTVVEETIYRLKGKNKDIAVRRPASDDIAIWHGEPPVFAKLFFVSDALKDAWSAVGMNPDVFVPCLDA